MCIFHHIQLNVFGIIFCFCCCCSSVFAAERLLLVFICTLADSDYFFPFIRPVTDYRYWINIRKRTIVDNRNKVLKGTQNAYKIETIKHFAKWMCACTCSVPYRAILAFSWPTFVNFKHQVCHQANRHHWQQQKHAEWKLPFDYKWMVGDPLLLNYVIPRRVYAVVVVAVVVVDGDHARQHWRVTRN